MEPQKPLPPLGEGDALVALGQALWQRGYRFVTVSPATHARVHGRQPDGWARSLTDVFGWSRPFQPELLPEPLFQLMCAAGVVSRIDGGWHSQVRFSTLPCAGDELLCVHSAYPTAGAEAVFFGPDTYRFCRAIEQWLARSGTPPRRAIDIGTGSGAGALVIARHTTAEVHAIDINIQALRLCQVNAAMAGIDSLRIGYSDLLQQVEGEFDLITANPPYLLDPRERLYRHGGGSRGEALSIAIAKAALTRLAPGGTLLLYSGVAIVDGRDALLEGAKVLLAQGEWTWQYEEIDPDVFGEELDNPAYADADRIAAVLLRVSRC